MHGLPIKYKSVSKKKYFGRTDIKKEFLKEWGLSLKFCSSIRKTTDF